MPLIVSVSPPATEPTSTLLAASVIAAMCGSRASYTALGFSGLVRSSCSPSSSSRSKCTRTETSRPFEPSGTLEARLAMLGAATWSSVSLLGLTSSVSTTPPSDSNSTSTVPSSGSKPVPLTVSSSPPISGPCFEPVALSMTEVTVGSSSSSFSSRISCFSTASSSSSPCESRSPVQWPLGPGTRTTLNSSGPVSSYWARVLVHSPDIASSFDESEPVKVTTMFGSSVSWKSPSGPSTVMETKLPEIKPVSDPYSPPKICALPRSEPLIDWPMLR